MTLDPRWLEILKVSGWQTAALALSCGLFIWAGQSGWVPALEAWMIQLSAFGLSIFGCLAIASFISNTLKFFPVHVWFVHWINTRKKKKWLRDYIPFMTGHEKSIIAYLLYHNQKIFTADSDGGYASTLLAKRIVQIAAQPGQHIDMTDVPMMIPDFAWEVLADHKNLFPYTPSGDSGHPWRIPWNLR